jgi:ATP-dependent DNA helicase RecG
VVDLTGVSTPYAGTLLTNLEACGVLKGGRPNRLGRGFFYGPVREVDSGHP